MNHIAGKKSEQFPWGKKFNKKESKQEDYQMKRGNQGAKKEKSKTRIQTNKKKRKKKGIFSVSLNFFGFF